MNSLGAEGSPVLEPEPPPPAPQQPGSFGPQDNAVIRFLMFAAVVGCAYLARSFVLMVAVSLVAAMALSPIVRGARRLGIPRLVGSVLVVACSVVAIGYAATRLVVPVSAWLERSPAELERLDEAFGELAAYFERFSEASARLDALTEGGEKDDGEVVVNVKGASVTDLVLAQTPEMAGAAIGMVILVFFTLAYGELFLNNLLGVSDRLDQKKRIVVAARSIERRVSRYLATVATVNLCLGALVGGAMSLLGFPNPWLWGIAAAALNFVPYIGSIVGVAIMGIVALVTYDSALEAALFPSVYAGLTFIEGNLVTPMILGRSFALNPLAIIVSLLFFGWLWGAAGALLAVPLMVILKTVGEQSGLERWARVIGD